MINETSRSQQSHRVPIVLEHCRNYSVAEINNEQTRMTLKYCRLKTSRDSDKSERYSVERLFQAGGLEQLKAVAL